MQAIRSLPFSTLRHFGLRNKHTLVLVRHGESEWNKTNRFTGWKDVPLSATGIEEAKQCGELLRKNGFEFDVFYTSVLTRANQTLDLCVGSEVNKKPTVYAWELNERHYGALTGLNKQETVERHGKEQVHIWRRSWDIPPPPLDDSSPYYPGDEKVIATVPRNKLPRCESLKDTAARVIPYWITNICPVIKSGSRVLIVAHGNSLRSLVMHLDNISENEITDLNIPTAIPLVYEFDDEFHVIPHSDAIAPLRGRYLGDQQAIRAKILGVKKSN